MIKIRLKKGNPKPKAIKGPIYGFGKRPTKQCTTCGHTYPSNRISCGFCAMIAGKSLA